MTIVAPQGETVASLTAPLRGIFAVAPSGDGVVIRVPGQRAILLDRNAYADIEQSCEESARVCRASLDVRESAARCGAGTR